MRFTFDQDIGDGKTMIYVVRGLDAKEAEAQLKAMFTAGRDYLSTRKKKPAYVGIRTLVPKHSPFTEIK